MEIYIAVLEEDARAAGKDADLRAFNDRDEGMRAEYDVCMHVCMYVCIAVLPMGEGN